MLLSSLDRSLLGTYKDVHKGEPNQLTTMTPSLVALCSYQLIIPGQEAPGTFPADSANPLVESVSLAWDARLALSRSHGQGDGIP